MKNDNSALTIAQSIVPLLQDTAESAEQSGVLAPEVLAAFDRHNLWGLYVPVELGGLGLSPTEALEVIETISYADGSSGWVLSVAFAAAVSMAYLPDKTVSNLFVRGRKTPVIAGSGSPNGTAVPVDDGFMLSGRWSYGSGVKHADYILVGGVVMDGNAPRTTDDGSPELRLFIVPHDQVAFDNNWDVVGLRATASVDYTIDNIFVPESYCYLMSSRSGRRGEFYRLGYASLVPIGHAGFALGVGRRLLDELSAFAQHKTGAGGIGESEAFHEQFAHHEAALRSARAFLMEVWPGVEKVVYAGGDLKPREDTLIRLSLAHVTAVATDIATFAYRSAGGTSLRAGVIQRCFRDMLAGAQHITSAPSVMRVCGRELAGLTPGHVWAGWNLVDSRGTLKA